MQLESLESMIKDYERRTGERVSLEGFYFDENNNYKDKYNYYFKWFPNAGFLFWTMLNLLRLLPACNCLS